MAGTSTHQLTLRIPASTHERLRQLAAGQGKSLNRVALEALELAVRREREDAVTAAFDRYALDDPEEASVEFAFEAQAQVVRRDG